jgi:hypothetical protein
MKVDPVFAEAVNMLFGDAVDPREAWANVSKMDDASEAHIPGNNKVVGKKKKTPIKVVSTAADSMAAVTKGIDELVAEVVADRYLGRITTESALDRIEMIEKGFIATALKDVQRTRWIPKKQKASITQGLYGDGAQETALRRGAMGVGAALGFGGGALVATKRPQALRIQRAAPVKKSDTLDTVWTGEISKIDEEKRQVFGWCSLSEMNGEPVVDLQGDYVSINEIEKSAYGYVLTSRKGGDMHARDGEVPLHTSDLIESFVVTPEKLEKMGLPGNALPLGWWVGFKVNDDKQWEDVKVGKRAGFSIHGKGSRVEKVLT